MGPWVRYCDSRKWRDDHDSGEWSTENNRSLIAPWSELNRTLIGALSELNRTKQKTITSYAVTWLRRHLLWPGSSAKLRLALIFSFIFGFFFPVFSGFLTRFFRIFIWFFRFFRIFIWFFGTQTWWTKYLWLSLHLWADWVCRFCFLFCCFPQIYVIFPDFSIF